MDIVERLRKLPAALSGRNTAQVVYEVSDEAADEIERLRAALQNIKEHARNRGHHVGDVHAEYYRMSACALEKINEH